MKMKNSRDHYYFFLVRIICVTESCQDFALVRGYFIKNGKTLPKRGQKKMTIFHLRFSFCLTFCHNQVRLKVFLSKILTAHLKDFIHNRIRLEFRGRNGLVRTISPSKKSSSLLSFCAKCSKSLLSYRP